jgi:membrane protein
MIYKVLPNVNIAWENVWIGAAITALLFEIGKVLIGLYIGKSSVASSFGAAGPFVVLMLWIYYSTQIFLLGAEFTFAYTHRGRPIACEQERAAVSRDHSAGDVGLAPPVSGPNSRLPYQPTSPEVLTSPGWAKRAWAASAAGLVAGFIVTRVVRGNSSKVS